MGRGGLDGAVEYLLDMQNTYEDMTKRLVLVSTQDVTKGSHNA